MKKRVFALFTAMFLLCGMLAGCGPTGSSSTTTDGSDDGAKDTLIVAIPHPCTLSTQSQRENCDQRRAVLTHQSGEPVPICRTVRLLYGRVQN